MGIASAACRITERGEGMRAPEVVEEERDLDVGLKSYALRPLKARPRVSPVQ